MMLFYFSPNIKPASGMFPAIIGLVQEGAKRR